MGRRRWVLRPSGQGLGKLWGQERQPSRDVGSTAPQQPLNLRPSEKELPAPSVRPLTQQAVRRHEPGLELHHTASRPSSASPSHVACGSFVTRKMETLIEGGGRLNEMVHALQRTAPGQRSANIVISVLTVPPHLKLSCPAQWRRVAGGPSVYPLRGAEVSSKAPFVRPFEGEPQS